MTMTVEQTSAEVERLKLDTQLKQAQRDNYAADTALKSAQEIHELKRGRWYELYIFIALIFSTIILTKNFL